MMDNQRMAIFIEIFLNIFNETTSFKKTRSQPLLPNQTVIQPNKFREECRKFTSYYRSNVDLTDITPIKIGRQYQKDANRARKIAMSFINSFAAIKDKLLQDNEKNQFKFYKVCIENEYDYTTCSQQVPYIIRNTNTDNRDNYEGNHNIKNNTFIPKINMERCNYNVMLNNDFNQVSTDAINTMRVRSAVPISENTDPIAQIFARIVYTELSNHIIGCITCVWWMYA